MFSKEGTGRREADKLYFFRWGELSCSDWVAFAIAAVFCFFIFYYADITVTARFSMIFIDSAFDGHWLSFYDNALASGIAPEGAVYDIGTYVVFALWGFPIWILNRFFSVEVLSVGSLLWFKTLLVVLTGWSLKILIDVALELEVHEKVRKMMPILFLTSSVTFFPIMIAVQYDIISVLLMLKGVLVFLRYKEKKKYIVFFAGAMLIKPFALFPFVALVLLREKKIIKIIRNICIGCLPLLACKLFYSFSPGYQESSGDFLTNMLPNLFSLTLPTGYFDFSVFMLLLFIVYIYCYGYKEEYTTRAKRTVVLILGAIWLSFCVFMGISPYWSIYLAPFLVLMICLNKHINFAAILELVFNLFMTVVFIMKYPWVYGGQKAFSYLLLKSLYDRITLINEPATVAGLLRKVGCEALLPAIMAMVLASSIYLFFITVKSIRENGNGQDQEKVEIWHVRIRIVLIYVWIAISVSAFILGVMGY